MNNGTIDNANAATAQSAASAFYKSLGGLSATPILPSLDGVKLGPGVYSTGAALLDSGDTLTLNFNGPNEDIVLQIASTLTIDSGSSVVVENLGTNDNVYYQVGSSATLDTGSVFQGDILALTSISLKTGANIPCGSVIALNGAVTLEDNTISNCSASGSDVSSTVPTSVTPEPGALVLLSTGLLAGAGLLRRRLFA